MTIVEMAKELGVAPMTVYRRLKRKGLAVADLRDADGGLTAEGVAAIASLFDATFPQRAPQADATQTQPAAQPDAQRETETAAVLAAKLDAANETIRRLDAEIELLRGQVSTLTGLLQAEQSTAQRLLTDGRRAGGGLFGWLRRGKGGC